MRATAIVSSFVFLLAARVASAQSVAEQTEPQKLVPPPPPPWDQGLSTSGVDVVSNGGAPREATHDAPHAMHSAQIHALEKRIEELERLQQEKPSVPPWVEWLKPSLLLQPQLVWNFYNAAASPNSTNGLLPPGVGSNDVSATGNGNTTNPDFFRLRRARLKLDFLPTEYARFVFEIEPVPRDPTIPGSGTIARENRGRSRVHVQFLQKSHSTSALDRSKFHSAASGSSITQRSPVHRSGATSNKIFFPATSISARMSEWKRVVTFASKPRS